MEEHLWKDLSVVTPMSYALCGAQHCRREGACGLGGRGVLALLDEDRFIKE